MRWSVSINVRKLLSRYKTKFAVRVPVGIRWLVTFSYVILIVILSVTPGQDQIDDGIFVWLVVNTPTLLQKTMHVAVYAGLSFLWMWAMEKVWPRVVRLSVSFILPVSLGVFLEWYQTSIPGRFGTLLDVLLNSGGSALGLLAALLVF